MSKTILIIATTAIMQGCCYHKEVTNKDGSKTKIHIGFPEFSENKNFNLIKK